MKRFNMTGKIFRPLILASFFVLTGWLGASAQKFAYVDSDYILNQIPEYRSAQKQLDELSNKWQKEVDKLYADIDKMYQEYNAEKVLLTAEQRKQREAEIVAKRKDAKEYQNSKFGYEGELFKKREELIKPIQDRVFEAIQTVAKRQNFDFIFDKSGEMVMLFTNSRYDVSAEVLEELGVTPLEDNLPGEGNGDGNLPDENLPPGE